jgi:hypothetical protein
LNICEYIELNMTSSIFVFRNYISKMLHAVMHYKTWGNLWPIIVIKDSSPPRAWVKRRISNYTNTQIGLTINRDRQTLTLTKRRKSNYTNTQIGLTIDRDWQTLTLTKRRISNYTSTQIGLTILKERSADSYTHKKTYK